MSTCFNCASAAAYKVVNLGAKEQLYCANHLPKFINLAKHLGDVVHEIGAVAKEVKKPVPTPPKKKKEEPVIEAPVVEAPVAEEPVAEQAE